MKAQDKTILLIDGRNFLGKIETVFKEAGIGHPDWSKYDFRRLFSGALSDIVLSEQVFYFARINQHPSTIFEIMPNKGLVATTNKTILFRNTEVLSCINAEGTRGV